MIFKLQRSLTPTGRMLIYNEDRSILIERPLRPDIEAAFGGRIKVYVEGELIDGDLIISHKVPAQPW